VPEIPCCLCGTRILPNAANQCGTCLASKIDLAGALQAGPGNAPHVTIHQCRVCRRFARTSAKYEDAEMESPELLSICLKHIPALSSSNSNSSSSSALGHSNLRLIDAGWIWTEPHSMRLQLHLTVRTEVEAVTIQQRLRVEQHVAWQMCDTCNREFSNRTWHALVQLRQYRSDDAPKRGLTALEMALARNKDVRKHVLKMNGCANGFDFYFLQLNEAQLFVSYVHRVSPMRVKTSSKMVSEDVKNNTANMKHTVTCDILPLCRDDLVVVHKKANCKLSGRLALVTKVSSTVHLMDAAPAHRYAPLSTMTMELGADAYYKNDKSYRLLLAGHRLTRFVVLDVELCQPPSPSNAQASQLPAAAGEPSSTRLPAHKGPDSGVRKYALADVMVARESDWGVNDATLSTVCHLGHLIQPGDVVLGYDLSTTVGGDWELEKFLNSGVLFPDVVLVKKVASGADGAHSAVHEDGEEKVSAAPPSGTGEKPAMTKKMARRRRRYEGKKARELEESAMRMGFLQDDLLQQDAMMMGEMEEDEQQVLHGDMDDAEFAEEVSALEREFASMDVPHDAPPSDEDSWHVVEES
jgi:nonsense-mediated mRNA decay protein 3